MRGIPGQCKVFQDTWYFINAVCGLKSGNVKKYFFTVKLVVHELFSPMLCSNGQPVISCNKWNKIYRTILLQLWKGTKIFDFLPSLFYKKHTRQHRCKRIQLHGKNSCISNNIRYFSSKFTVQNSNGSAPNKQSPS